MSRRHRIRMSGAIVIPSAESRPVRVMPATRPPGPRAPTDRDRRLAAAVRAAKAERIPR